MGYDISIMKTGKDGKVDYRYSGLSGRCVGSDKLMQHFIKHLYADDIGGLIKLIRETHGWDETNIRIAILNTTRYIEKLQVGKSLHPAEKLVSVKIDKIEILRKEGVVNMEFTLKTQAGSISVSL